VNLEIGVVAVGFAGQQAVDLARFDVVAQLGERFLRLVEHRLVAFGLGYFGKAKRVGEFAFDALVAPDEALEPSALAHQLLRARGIVPEIGRFDEPVQLIKPTGGNIPVKDAS